MRYTTDVIADSVQFLEPRGTQAGGGAQPGFGGNQNQSFPQQNNFGNQSQGNFNQPNSGFNQNQQQGFSNQSGANFNNNNDAPSYNSTINVSDDDLPF